MLSLKAYARTALLGAVLATATFGVATLATSGPVRAEVSNVSLPTIPFQLKNQSKLKKDLYVYIVGMSGADWVHVTDANGTLEVFTEQTTPAPFGFNVGMDKISTASMAPFPAGSLPQRGSL